MNIETELQNHHSIAPDEIEELDALTEFIEEIQDLNNFRNLFMQL